MILQLFVHVQRAGARLQLKGLSLKDFHHHLVLLELETESL